MSTHVVLPFVFRNVLRIIFKDAAVMIILTDQIFLMPNSEMILNDPNREMPLRPTVSYFREEFVFSGAIARDEKYAEKIRSSYCLSYKMNGQNHSKWALVGYSGGSPGLENAVKRWGGPIGPIYFSVYFDASP